MTENFGDSPRNSWKLAEKAPFLGKWLWILFWLVIPQSLASLLTSDLFAGQPVLSSLGQIMQLIYLLGCGLVLLKLSSQIARYRTAGIYFLVGGMINAAFSIIPVPAAGSALAVWGSLVIVAGGIFLMVGEYHEYMGHSELLEGVDWEVAQAMEVVHRLLHRPVELYCSGHLLPLPWPVGDIGGHHSPAGDNDRQTGISLPHRHDLPELGYRTPAPGRAA